MASTTDPAALPLIHVLPNLIVSNPRSRRRHGPGLILVIDHYALLEKSEKHIDPPPLTKWAEEGYAVAQVQVPGKDGGEFPLERAIEELKKLESCDNKESFALICTSFLSFFSFRFFKR